MGIDIPGQDHSKYDAVNAKLKAESDKRKVYDAANARLKGEDSQREATAGVGKKGLDLSYGKDVARYFNEQRAIAAQTVDLEGDLTYDQVLGEHAIVLGKLTYPDKVKKMSPKEVSLALANTAGDMAIWHDEALRDDTGETDKKYDTARKIFMGGCEKILSPLTEKDLQISSVIAKLKSALPDIQLPRIQDFAFRTRDPKEIARQRLQQYEQLRSVVTDAMKRKAYDARNDLQLGGGTDAYDKAQEKMADAVEAVYALQRLIDDTQVELYGKADILPSEARRIDAGREKIKGTVLTEQEKKDTTPPEIRLLLKKIGGIKGALEQGGLTIRVDQLKFGSNDTKALQEIVSGLEKIWISHRQDASLPRIKREKFQKQIDDLWEKVRQQGS